MRSLGHVAIEVRGHMVTRSCGCQSRVGRFRCHHVTRSPVHVVTRSRLRRLHGHQVRLSPGHVSAGYLFIRKRVAVSRVVVSRVYLGVAECPLREPGPGGLAHLPAVPAVLPAGQAKLCSMNPTNVCTDTATAVLRKYCLQVCMCSKWPIVHMFSLSFDFVMQICVLIPESGEQEKLEREKVSKKRK